jgi:hypothetical protein
MWNMDPSRFKLPKSRNPLLVFGAFLAHKGETTEHATLGSSKGFGFMPTARTCSDNAIDKVAIIIFQFGLANRAGDFHRNLPFAFARERNSARMRFSQVQVWQTRQGCRHNDPGRVR